MAATWLAVAAVGVRQVSTDPTCNPVCGIGDVPGWLLCQADAYSSLLVAAATGVAALIAGLAYCRERRRQRERVESYDARVEPLAFALYREMLFWQWEEPEDDADSPQEAEDALRHARDLEGRVRELAVMAPEASKEKSKHVTKAVAAYYQALPILRMLSRDARVASKQGEEEVTDEVRERYGIGFLWGKVEEFREAALDHLHEASGDLASETGDETYIDMAAPL